MIGAECHALENIDHYRVEDTRTEPPKGTSSIQGEIRDGIWMQSGKNWKSMGYVKVSYNNGIQQALCAISCE